MMRVARFLVGLLLLPACVAVTRAAIDLATSAHPPGAGAIPPGALAVAGGYVAWLAIFLTLPRPVRSYILAHELTHALWGWLMGAEILDLKVRGDGGSVTLSKTNFLITLAPYFFPLYTALVVLGYFVLAIFFDVQRYHLVWLALVGFSWGFHFTFTIATLAQHQTDVQRCGHLFSYTVIYLMNLLGVCLWIVLVSGPTIQELVGVVSHYLWETTLYLRSAGEWLVGLVRR